MNVIQSFLGMVTIEITTADISSFLDEVSRREILSWRAAATGDLTIVLDIARGDVRKVRDVCEKRGDKLRLVGRKGLYWQAKTMIKRPVLVSGLIFLLLWAMYLPGKIYFVRVEGNNELPTRQIIAAAEDCGICFGASRREVRSEHVKNALIESLPQLQWAGVNTYGCVAVISVRERESLETVQQESGYGNVVAVRDGVIVSCTATKGNLLCKEGQAVTEGEILISGYMDCGICIRAVQAEGEVYARTRRSVSAVMPAQMLHRTEKKQEFTKISLLIGKKRINLWKDSGISDTTCVRIYEEYYVTLPGGFQLPLGLAVESCTVWNTVQTQLENAESENLLSDFAESCLKQQMVAGAVQSSETTFLTEDSTYRFEGVYVCVEMIASRQRQQIGEYNGKNS